ncbi:MAG TPA: LrgB family protein [Stellaceae bacterium]|nr:LrgB family protein [Stellaceae bacterium]
MTALPGAAVTGLGIAVTIGAYALSLRARKRYPSPLTTPVLFSTAIVVAVLLGSGISFADYGPAKQIMTFLLGPATVALALPLYKNRRVFFRNIVPAGCGLLAGSLGTMIVAGLTARVLGITPLLTSSIAIKSATVPIAVEIAAIIHGAPALTAIFVVMTGMLGASLGPWLMNRLGITHPVSRGLALGTISHGQGTAEAVAEGQLSGAVAGVAMGLGAVCTSLAALYVVPLLAG